MEGIGYGIMRWKLPRETADFLHNLFPLHAMYKLIDDPIRRLAKMKVTDNEFLNYDYVCTPMKLPLYWVGFNFCLFFL